MSSVAATNAARSCADHQACWRGPRRPFVPLTWTGHRRGRRARTFGEVLRSAGAGTAAGTSPPCGLEGRSKRSNVVPQRRRRASRRAGGRPGGRVGDAGGGARRPTSRRSSASASTAGRRARAGRGHLGDERARRGGPAVEVERGDERVGRRRAGRPRTHVDLGVDDRAAGRRAVRASTVVGPRPHPLADLGQPELAGGVAERGAVARPAGARGHQASDPGPVPRRWPDRRRRGCGPPAGGRGGRGAGRRARSGRRRPSTSPAAAIRDSAVRVAPSRRPNSSPERTRASAGQARRVDAEQGRGDHRPGGERGGGTVSRIVDTCRRSVRYRHGVDAC